MAIKDVSESEASLLDSMKKSSYRSRAFKHGLTAWIVLGLMFTSFAGWLWYNATKPPTWISFDEKTQTDELLRYVGYEVQDIVNKKKTMTEKDVFDSEPIRGKVAETLTRVYGFGSDNDKTLYMTLLIFQRVASGIILFFLISILFSIYKYNSKLRAFYQARHELEQLVLGTAPDFRLENAMQYLNPISIGFEETKSPVTKEVKELLEIASKFKTPS